MALFTENNIDISGIVTARSDRPARLRTEDNVVVQANYTNIDGDIDIAFEQSLDGVKWDAILDDNNNTLMLRLKKGAKGKNFVGEQIQNFIGFFSTNIRAVIFKNNATEGIIDSLIISV